MATATAPTRRRVPHYEASEWEDSDEFMDMAVVEVLLRHPAYQRLEDFVYEHDPTATSLAQDFHDVQGLAVQLGRSIRPTIKALGKADRRKMTGRLAEEYVHELTRRADVEQVPGAIDAEGLFVESRS